MCLYYNDIYFGQAWLDFIHKYFVDEDAQAAVYSNTIVAWPAPKDMVVSAMSVFPIKSCATMVVQEWPINDSGV